MPHDTIYSLGIDIGSTTVKVALLDSEKHLLFSDYRRHFADIQGTLADLIQEARDKTGPLTVCPVITGSGGLTLAGNMQVPFVQEVIAVSSALQLFAPQTDRGREDHLFPGRFHRTAHERYLRGRNRILYRPDGVPASD